MIARYRCPLEPRRLDADPLALQVADGADRLVREQLVAAGMHARQRRDRHAGIQATDERCREVEAEVDLAACRPSARREAACDGHIADIGEAFRAQQVLGDVPRARRRCSASTAQPDRGRFRRRLRRRAIAGRQGRQRAAANDALARKSRRDCMICM